MESTSVLIVGGSLVGLSQALFLAHQGVDCVLVERHQGLSAHPRARGINPRTMELFRQAGVEGRLRAAESARALAGNSGVVMAHTLAGEHTRLDQAYFMDTDTDFSEHTPVAWCLCHQDEAEPAIAARARELGADLRFGTELTGFTSGGDGVTATVRDVATGATRTIRAGYLVAADGARGRVREELGIPLTGPGTISDFLNISFTADLREVLGDRRFVICYLRALPMRAALLPVNNADRWLMHVECDPARAAAMSEEECRELVRTGTGVPDLAVTIEQAAPWPMAAAVADAFRAGRVLLAGDAAHVMPPTGAFGSNTGIQDAHNLAWKLALVLRGRAAPALLDTYDAERRPVAAETARQVVLRSRDRSRMTRGNGEEAAPAIRSDAELMFTYRYESAAVVPEGTGAPAGKGAPGVRVPHLSLVRPGARVDLLDLLGRGFVLLAAAGGAGWARAAAALAAERDLPLDAYRVVPALEEATSHRDVLADPMGRWPAVSGTGTAGALLVRPDGIVAWRATAASADPRAELAAALDRVLAGTAPSLV
ncbi:FAD-dependent oxidoreductase [Sphaerisporangium rufum]|uniref:FAD-dependent oxidoreductase n=1 Tax=Sphaerisporangium rufum TaxID=1381558 RepID=A0A919RA38_9ACTN|nr:FAD-dependent monooxygenase [Sphaerisporangium rufum]GII80965.1 FAD-dependent oxidoreductase [Sphaerisporangium rufum]